ncbi:MAG: hypothetical protein ACFFC7_17495 [Candidatus Hermodarchaeota archaeon]
MEKDFERIQALEVVAPNVRPYFSTQAARKMTVEYQNLLLKYGMSTLLMLGLIGVKLGYTIITLDLVGSSPLIGSENYLMIIGALILVLLIFSGAFIGIARRKIIGVVVCFLGIIIDIIVRAFIINELLSMIEELYWFDLLIRWLTFNFFDVILISLFIVGAIITVKVYNKKMRRQ